ncbi:Protein EPG-9 a [Aphelenchoides avenae]|nr:Protein EPG-9 a [Aphelenchus avenae]
MNARNQHLQLTVECRQVKDATLCIFHTLLLHRTVGKFSYTSDVNYTLGSIGIEEVDCEQIDLTYVRVNSPELVADVDEKVRNFSDAVQTVVNAGFYLSGSQQSPQSSPGRDGKLYGIDRWENLMRAQVRLEFYQRRKRQWPMPEDHIPWEVWNLQLDVVRTEKLDDFCRMREYTGEKLADELLSLCQLMNRPQYLPKMPTRSELPLIFEDRFSDSQPYLFRIESDYGKSMDASARGSSFVRKLFKDTLTFSN